MIYLLDIGTFQWLSLLRRADLPHHGQRARNNIEWPVERHHIPTGQLLIPVKARHSIWLVRLGELEIFKAPPHLIQACPHRLPLDLDHDWLDDAEAAQWPTSVVSKCQQMPSECGDILEHDLLDGRRSRDRG